MDPPEHTKMRRLVSRAFTPRRIADLEPHVRDLATMYIDRFIGEGSCDLIGDFGGKLPMDVISEMLGVPEADRDTLREWTDTMLHRETGEPEMTPAGEEAGAKVFQYFLDHVRAKRGTDGDDLVSGLLEVEVDGEELSDIDIVAFCFLLIIAGNETTTKLIGNALWWLSRFPDQKKLILDDPDLIPEAVEETLRYDGSTQLMARTLNTRRRAPRTDDGSRREGAAAPRFGQPRRAFLGTPRRLRHPARQEAAPRLRARDPRVPRRRPGPPRDARQPRGDPPPSPRLRGRPRRRRAHALGQREGLLEHPAPVHAHLIRPPIRRRTRAHWSERRGGPVTLPTFAPNARPEAVAEALTDHGATVVERLAPAELCDRVEGELGPWIERTPPGGDDFSGHDTRRTGALLARSVRVRAS
ncbi:MAG: hypothetical protein U5R31_01690 [Acidimicrobiia bacterium]|nr:hypothetical protein [Acidimicrobiia bacterium]